MKTFEEQLREQKRVALPEHWKEEILSRAMVEAQEPTGFHWWFPRPLRWGLAALWIGILTLNLTTPKQDKNQEWPGIATFPHPSLLLAELNRDFSSQF